MFSLIITIISIALVAVLALATLYYGGAAFTKGSNEAQASALKNQGQQLLAAAEGYYLEHQAWPQTPQDLVDEGFLKAIPVAGVAISAAQAAAGWTMPVPGVPVFANSNIAPEVCRQVNFKAYSLAGVLPQFHTQFVQQCAGADLSNLTVVTARNGRHLQDAAGALAVPVVTTDIPAPENESAWLVLPGADRVAAPAPGSGGSGDTPVVKGVLTPSAEQLLFGSVATNTSASQTLTLSNAGPGVVVFQGAPGLSGSASYSIVDSTCTTLAVDAACTVTVQFAPTEVGEGQTATLTWSSSAENSAGTLELEGSAFNPVSLQGATLPSATVGSTYTPYNFATRLAVSNEQSPDLAQATWTAPSNLPSGMTFENGVLAGTPTSSASARTLEVAVAYKGNEALADFVLTVLANPNGFSDVAAGSNTTCGVTGDGGIKCWGQGTNGFLGNGTNTNVNLPSTVTGITAGATAVAMSLETACGVVNGGVRCWGKNDYGQLGINANSPVYSNVPVTIGGIPEAVVGLAAGAGHLCALTTGGSAYCWGANGSDGRLGTGATSTTHLPAKVKLAAGDVATRLAASNVSTCAVLSTGKVKCWGKNFGTQPVEVTGLPGMASVTSVMDSYSPPFHCGLTTGGDAYCWTTPTDAVRITGVTNAQAVVAGAYKTCAIEGNSVKCWMPKSMVATSVNSTAANSAVSVTGLPGTPAKLAIGSGHLCVQLTDSRIYCTGTGTSGQLGNGSNSSITLPAVGTKVGG